jgi:hypothetical protein
VFKKIIAEFKRDPADTVRLKNEHDAAEVEQLLATIKTMDKPPRFIWIGAVLYDMAKEVDGRHFMAICQRHGLVVANRKVRRARRSIMRIAR